MKHLALIIAFLLIAPQISMAQETYVVNVMVNDEPVREINGVAYVSFGSEYKLLIKNNTDSRCSARVYIDGSRVSPGGDFVIDSHDKLTLERFVTDMDSGKKFKFVPLGDTAVDDPSRAENGIVRVEFRKEAVPMYELRIGDTLIGKYRADTIVDISGEGGKQSFRIDKIKDCSIFEWGDSGIIYVNSDLGFYDSNVTTTSSSIPNGATIAGSESTQRFHKVDYDFEESFVEVKLMIKGLEDYSKQELSWRMRELPFYTPDFDSTITFPAYKTEREALKHCKEPYQLCVGGGCWICP